MSHFSRRLLTSAGILVLAVTVLATMVSAGTIDKATPQMQVGNTGEVWMPEAQRIEIIPEAAVDLTPKTLVGNTGETLTYVFQGHDITPPADRGGLMVLYCPSEADNATFRADLAACIGGTVDYFDPRVTTPDVATLSGYDVVMTWVNYAYLDNVGFGDNLAAYVDGGGKVILGQWCLPTAGNYLSGAIMTEAYCPVTGSAYENGTYNLDGTDCVNDGVSDYASDYFDVATPVAGAITDGTFNNPSNSLAVAWRADRMVYSTPGNTGVTYGTGDWATVTCGMVTCDDGGGPGTTGPVLYCPTEADNATFRADLAACIGDDVDYFDPRVATPDLATLSGYGMVVTWVNYAYLDNVAMGDVLAEYVDGGGKVVLGQWCLPTAGNFLSGAIMTEAYCPVTGSSYESGSYNADGTECETDGVTTLASDYFDVATAISGAVSDGTFNNPSNSLAVAWRADQMVYSTPGNTGNTYGTGEWADLLCNIYQCSGGEEPTGMPLIVTGPGAGADNPPQVRVWDPNDSMAMLSDFAAYGAEDYGVNVACGDLDGDGIDSVVTGPGPGAIFGPHVRAFDYMGMPVDGVNYFAYGTLKYGVNVACGDLDGDGMDEIITGAGPGAVFGPHVRGWNVDGGTAESISGINAFAYNTLKWGVNVCCGDIDGDGFDEIVTGAGPGLVYGPHVRGWNVDGGALEPIFAVSYYAYSKLRYGVNVACGDLDGDGIDEIITAPGAGVLFGPQIRGWNYDGNDWTTPMAGVDFFAYDEGLYGAQLGAVDLDGDGMCEILTMPGPDSTMAATVRAWNVDGGTAELITGIDADAYSDLMLMYGGKVGGGGF